MPTFANVIERVLYNSIFDHFHHNGLFNKCKSGFPSGDSCIYQLHSIIQEIQSSFDSYPFQDVKTVFVEISMAFDEVWHEGFICKQKSSGI